MVGSLTTFLAEWLTGPVTQSIVQVIIIALFGFILAKRGVISPANQKWLSNINMRFFTPTLLFTKMAFIITPQKFLSLWPIPVFYAIFSLFSFLLARLGSRILHLDNRYRDFSVACIMFSNTNSLPIAVLQSLAFSQVGEALFWKDDDSQEAVEARGISYILFFAIFGNLVRWSYGFNIIRGPSTTIPMNPNPLQRHGSRSTVPVRFSKPLPFVREGVLVDISPTPSPPVKRGLSRMDTAEYLGMMNENGGEERGGWPTSRGSGASRLDREETVLEEDDENDEEYEPPMVPQADFSTGLHAFPSLNDDESGKGFWARIASQPPIRPVAKVLRKIINAISPPLLAAILALIVGLIPPLKNLLFDPKKFLYPSFTRALEHCSDVAIPLVLVCLGAQMYGLPIWSSTQNFSGTSSGPSPSSVSVRFVLIARVIIVPLFVIPAVLLFTHFGGAVSSIVQDPVFALTMIMLGCCPTAINLIQICQAKNAFEDEMGRVLFWSYVVIAVPLMTLVVLVALWSVTGSVAV